MFESGVKKLPDDWDVESNSSYRRSVSGSRRASFIVRRGDKTLLLPPGKIRIKQEVKSGVKKLPDEFENWDVETVESNSSSGSGSHRAPFVVKRGEKGLLLPPGKMRIKQEVVEFENPRMQMEYPALESLSLKPNSYDNQNDAKIKKEETQNNLNSIMEDVLDMEEEQGITPKPCANSALEIYNDIFGGLPPHLMKELPRPTEFNDADFAEFEAFVENLIADRSFERNYLKPVASHPVNP